ncbi:hypothetical protein [Cronobacter sakazakii]|uniref:hypothetical protein n=1 Tax=Cronobacter sakazakii TaxID=28141 RepID=UPI0015E3C5B2|nr:hypothetical protein [Cronobacter sakazakii]
MILTQPKKTAVLYHNDADGFASALAAWLRYGEEAHYIPVRYGEPVDGIRARWQATRK